MHPPRVDACWRVHELRPRETGAERVMGERSHIPTVAAETRPCAIVRGGWRACARALLAALALVVGLPAGAARAEPVKADVTVDVSRGFARIVLRFSDEIDADVRM